MTVLPSTTPETAPDDLARSADDALRAAALLIESGASGQAVTMTVDQIVDREASLPDAPRFVLQGDFVAVAAREDRSPVALLRPVGITHPNLERASAIEELGERVATGAVPRDRISEELDRIQASRHPYGPVTHTVAAGISGFAFAMLVGATPRTAALAVVACILGSFAQGALRAARMPAPIVIFGAALAASCIAAAGVRGGIAPLDDTSSLPAITWLIPGLALINGLLDILSIRHATLGMQRTLVALVTFLLIGAAIAIGVALAGGS